MSKYTEAEKQAILEQARATLEQGMDEAPYIPPSESQLEAWKRREEQQEAAREKVRKESEVAAIERRIQGQLQALLTDSFKGLVEAEHQYLMEQLLPELFAELRNAIADRVRLEIKTSYKTAVTELRNDVAALKVSLNKLTGNGDVIEHPSLKALRAH
jgi:hypothetical protein